MMRAIFLFGLICCAKSSAAQTFETGIGIQCYFLPGTVLETYSPSSANGPNTYSDKVFSVVPALSYDLTFNFPVFEREGYAFGFQLGGLLNGMLRQEGWLLGTRGDGMISFRTGAHASHANYVEGVRFFGVAGGVSSYSVINTTADYSDRIFYIVPAMLLETGIDDHKVRLFVQLAPHKSTYPSLTGDIPKITYWQFGFSWEKYFDLVRN